MSKQPFINTFDDQALKQKTVRDFRNTPPPEQNLRSVKTTSTADNTGTRTFRPLKTTLAATQVSQTSNSNVYTGGDRVIQTPGGTVIIDTDKDVIVNTYEEVVEQRYFNNISGGTLDVGTTVGTTFNNIVGYVTKLGFDSIGFTVNDLGGGLARISLDSGSVLTQNVEVIGTDLGAVDEGYTFPAGMTFTDFVMTISQKTIPPTYNQPTLVLNGSPSPTSTEIGTIISPVFNRTFTQNDAGALTANRLYKDSVLISSSFPYTDTGVQLVEIAIQYDAEVDYAQGPIKNNNMGVPDPAGRINAGTVSSNTLTYIGLRKGFYGTPLTTPSNNTEVRAMTEGTFDTTNNPDVNASGEDLVPNPNPNFTITIPIGATRVSFAYPATSRDVASVRYQELAFTEVRSNFTQTSVNVSGANGYSPVAYRVYTYVPVEPFSQEVHYLVFI